MALIGTTKFPYTGPLYGPSHAQPQSRNRSSVKGIKRAMIRMDYLQQELGSETDDFGVDLEKAFKEWFADEYDVRWAFYGQPSWMGLREAKVKKGPNKGQYAMDSLALSYVREDALKECYPHPAGVSGVYVGQGFHQTSGIPGNWAIDFMAPGGTKVLAVVNAYVTRLSGHPPDSGANQGIGIFGWSIYYETSDGYDFFSTHYGTRSVAVGQQVDCGQVIGTVGGWPGDPGRSHTHLGCSSSRGSTAAKAKILSISKAKRVTV